MRRITLTLLWFGVAVAAAGGAALRMLQYAQPDSYWGRLSAITEQPLNPLAYAIALFFCIRIMSDYAKGTPMRLAWTLMAASCSMSLIRHLFEWAAVQWNWTDTMGTTLVSLRQIPIELSFLLMAASLIIIWRAFTAFGLGVRFRWFDWALMVGVLLFVPVICSFPGEMQDSHSAYVFIRFLQSISPYLLALLALLAVVLYRTTMDMGSGQLSSFLRFLIFSVVMRLVSMAIWVWPAHADYKIITIAGRAIFFASHWVFLLAIGHRWLLTVSNSEMAVRYERNPEAEVAELSRAMAAASRPMSELDEMHLKF